MKYRIKTVSHTYSTVYFPQIKTNFFAQWKTISRIDCNMFKLMHEHEIQDFHGCQKEQEAHKVIKDFKIKSKKKQVTITYTAIP